MVVSLGNRPRTQHAVILNRATLGRLAILVTYIWVYFPNSSGDMLYCIIKCYTGITTQMERVHLRNKMKGNGKNNVLICKRCLGAHTMRITETDSNWWTTAVVKIFLQLSDLVSLQNGHEC